MSSFDSTDDVRMPLNVLLAQRPDLGSQLSRYHVEHGLWEE